MLVEAPTPSARLSHAYETITSQLPSAAVSEALLRAVADLEALYAEDEQLAEELCEGATLPDGATSAELAASHGRTLEGRTGVEIIFVDIAVRLIIVLLLADWPTR